LKTVAETGRSPDEIVASEGLAQIRDQGELERWVDEVLAAHPDEVARFRGGESRLRGFFMGQVMKASNGKADPGEVSRLLGESLGG
jgi:aspartyl-tRNA(Asn)/glutamyl-tRNA(Gln) amidotransferase subunit B